MSYSIEVKYDNKLNQDFIDFELPYSKNYISLEVIVDGSENLAHYTIHEPINNNNFISYKKFRNFIDITVNKNPFKTQRSITLLLTHNLNNNVLFYVNIRQKGTFYDIYFDDHTKEKNITFNPLYNYDNRDKYETETFNIECLNGYQDFAIKPIKLYTILDNNTQQDLSYDNAFHIKKINNNQLTITNYGKINDYDNIYYIVTLYHRNDPDQTLKIIINYNNINTTGFSFSDE